MIRECLEGVLERTEGAQAVLLMGLDGIPVEVVGLQGEILDSVSAEYSPLLKELQALAEGLGFGAVRENIIVLERLVLLFHGLPGNYFVVLALTPGGNYGRARYELSKAGIQLSSEVDLHRAMASRTHPSD